MDILNIIQALAVLILSVLVIVFSWIFIIKAIYFTILTLSDSGNRKYRFFVYTRILFRSDLLSEKALMNRRKAIKYYGLTVLLGISGYLISLFM